MTPAAKVAAIRDRLKTYRDDPVGFARDVLGMDLHDGQKRWLANSTSSENALVTGNRWGKSHVAAVKLIWKSLYRIGWNAEIRDAMARKHEDYRAINVALTANQAKIVWSKAYAMLQGDKAQWLVDSVVHTPFPTINFVTGATFEARSTANNGEYLLGNSYDAINWDEAAYDRNFLGVRDNVLRMRLVDRKGRLDYTSTGNGRNDFGLYFLTGLPGPKKDPNLYSQAGQSWENTFVPRSELELNAARMSARMRQQNIEGAIVDGGGDYFNLDDLSEAHDPELDEILRFELDDEEQVSHAWLEPDGKPWRDKYPSHRYVHGWDLADKSDWTVGTTWDVSGDRATLVEFERFHKRGWDYVYARIRDRHRKYGKAKATKIDSTGLGDVVENELRDIGAEGVKFTKQTKDGMLTNLQTLLSLRGLRWPMIRVMADEFSFYERDDAGLQTDCVMSTAVAGWWIKRGANRPIYVASI